MTLSRTNRGPTLWTTACAWAMVPGVALPPASSAYGCKVLAVDLGLRFGVAVYDDQGALTWCGSHHVRRRADLRHAAAVFIRRYRPEWIVSEGDTALARIWERAGTIVGARSVRVGPEQWRRELLMTRGTASSRKAKEASIRAARERLAAGPFALKHRLNDDCAEAVLIGAWAVAHHDSISGQEPTAIFKQPERTKRREPR